MTQQVLCQVANGMNAKRYWADSDGSGQQLSSPSNIDTQSSILVLRI